MVILEGRNVTKHFGAIAAVQSVDFSVHQGEILGIIGPNGAGKTTLFNVIAGVYRPDDGEVIFKGKPISGLKPHAVCRLGIVKTSQIVRPFTDLTVLENVLVASLYGKGLSIHQASQEAETITEFVGLGGLKRTPGGSITVPNRRRLELARALATGAELILLDETMAGLNPVEIESVLVMLRSLRERGHTLIIVEHVMQAVMAISDRVIVLNYGRKIAEGPPFEVANNDEVIKAYLGERYVSYR